LLGKWFEGITITFFNCIWQRTTTRDKDTLPEDHFEEFGSRSLIWAVAPICFSLFHHLRKLQLHPMGDDVTLPVKAIKIILGSLNFGAEIPQVNARI